MRFFVFGNRKLKLLSWYISKFQSVFFKIVGIGRLWAGPQPYNYFVKTKMI